MRVLGIDPGLTRCGVGVVDGSVGLTISWLRERTDSPAWGRLLIIEWRGRIGSRSLQAGWINLLDQQSVECTAEIACQAQRLRRGLALAPDQRGERKQPLQRIDRRWNRLGSIGRIEGTADLLVDVGIADGDQAREQQSGAALPDECIGNRADRAIVGKQDAPARKPEGLSAKPRDQPRRQRIRE